ncbi:hypothetical protein R1flu_008359 [Riccia fluitans]|uniref:Uncharacterized protein n=1 Tax=Riccia fluitans TaxID=41844 RepID=A0ABD1YCH6_9MARC
MVTCLKTPQLSTTAILSSSLNFPSSTLGTFNLSFFNSGTDKDPVEMILQETHLKHDQNRKQHAHKSKTDRSLHDAITTEENRNDHINTEQSHHMRQSETEEQHQTVAKNTKQSQEHRNIDNGTEKSDGTWANNRNERYMPRFTQLGTSRRLE